MKTETDGNEKTETRRKKTEGWDILYPEDKERYPKYYVKRLKYIPDDMREVNKLLKKLNRALAGDRKKKNPDSSRKGLPGKMSGRTQRIPPEQKQRCMAKMYYGSSKESHLKHLMQYMTQMKKKAVTEKPQLFGNVPLEEYKEKAAGRYYKWILSPEKKMTPEELEAFAKTFMNKMEEKTGKKYIWQAAVHTDTDHPHIHIVINGNDLEGKPIGKIDPQYVKKWARLDAQNILTSMLGKRTQEEIETSKEHALNADRLIDLDQTIAELDMNTEKRIQQHAARHEARSRHQEAINALRNEITKKFQKKLDEIEEKYGIDPQMDMSSKEFEYYYENVDRHQRPILDQIEKELQKRIAETPELQQPEMPEEHLPVEISDYDSVLGGRPDIRKRLEHLKDLGLARYANKKWTLDDDWQEKLKILGRYNMYLNAKDHINPESELKLYESGDGIIKGKLKWIYYMDDENVWTNAAVIEDAENKTAWYVPVYDARIFKGKTEEQNFRPGQDVVLRSVRNSRGKTVPRIYDRKKWDSKTDYWNKARNKSGQDYGS